MRKGSTLAALVSPTSGNPIGHVFASLRGIEKTVARPINPTIFNQDDFLRNFAQKNHFLLTSCAERKSC
jgi:hypothetical protein